mmetsp:Transcript_27012/g.61024  ORF Transcript_27012/g.61024 Transcript_27012/m.61024 type:complete len:537 (-) Transcript_27012:122-1732(-)
MVSVVNSRADVLKSSQALAVNCSAAKGLMEIMKNNLGPRGSVKMLVGGAGQVKITKDGCVLLKEMQIQHPTASMIARAATAQDDMTGDGTTTNVLIIGELLRQSERHIEDGLHPRILAEGFDLARQATMDFLEGWYKPQGTDRELLYNVAKTGLRTKLQPVLADQLAEIVVDACEIVSREGQALDLHMVEILAMKHKLATETKLIRGMVLDHGSRHPDMPKRLENCYILTCNVSLEYEKSEVNSTFAYSNAEQRDRLVDAERKFTDDKVQQVIKLKKEVCTEENKKTFVLINQKGIDPPSLELLAREGIIALRRAKRRNMERLTLAFGGVAVNSFEDLEVDDLGSADLVYEETLGDDKYTFIENRSQAEGVNRHSCCILVRGPNDHTVKQVEDAVRDGLRSVKNAMEDNGAIPGGGAFEIAAHHHLMQKTRLATEGKAKLGVEVFANALLSIPKTLAENSGFDVQELIIKAVDQHAKTNDMIGIDVDTGDTFLPATVGVWDNVCVKKQILNLAPVLAQQLLLVDEVIRAGRQMGGK